MECAGRLRKKHVLCVPFVRNGKPLCGVINIDYERGTFVLVNFHCALLCAISVVEQLFRFIFDYVSGVFLSGSLLVQVTIITNARNELSNQQLHVGAVFLFQSFVCVAMETFRHLALLCTTLL